MLPFRSLIVLLWISMSTYAQQSADTVLAHQYYQTADSLTEQGHYNKANSQFRKAQRIYQSAEDWDKYIACLNSIAYNMWPKADYDSATLIAQQALQLSEEYLNVDHPEVARAYDVLGIVQIYTAEYDRALEHFTKSLSIKKANYPKNHQQLTDAYEYIGVVHGQVANYDQALFYFQKVLTNRKKIYTKPHRLLADAYSNLSRIYQGKGSYEQALAYAQYALDMREKVFRDIHPDLVTSYNNLGYLYERVLSYDQALLYYTKALTTLKELFNDVHPDISTAYNNIGRLYSEIGSIDLALQNFQESIEITKAVFGSDHVATAATYNNIGIAFQNKGAYEQSLANYQKALQVLNVQPIKNYAYEASTLLNIGQLYHAKGDYPLALSYYEKSILSNKALINNLGSSTSYFVDGNLLLNALKSKAEVLSNMELYSAAFTTYQLADSLLSDLNRSKQAENDKIYLRQEARQIYEGAIRVSLRRYQDTQDDQYMFNAFYLNERGRAALLTEGLATWKANKFGQVPDSLLALESSLRVEQAIYRSQLRSPDSSVYETKLFNTNQRYDSLILALEAQYPDYYRLKYDTHTATVLDIQAQLVPNDAVISYFIGDSTYYAFAITPEHFRVVPLPVDTLLSERITSLRQMLSTDSFTVGGYRQAAYALYQQLLAPVVADSTSAAVKKLTIIPDGVLGYLPFELLLTQPATTVSEYADLPYLLRDYTVRYGYSATWLFHPFSRLETSASNQYVAFAPHYPATVSDSVQQLAFGRFRNQVAPLRWNQQEVSNIDEYLSGVNYTQGAAVERRFKEEVSQYRVVHLAMHALIDDQNPMYSRLVFSQDTADTQEDGSLNAYELYNMEIPAELVVLSACETGYGKLERGEGIMSLARAFAYAGCPSIVMSHWLVDDKASAQLMDHFYRHLSEGLPKDEALRQAKVAYLEAASVQKSHPFFWSNFVLIGNTDPLSSVGMGENSLWYAIGFWLLLTTLVWVVYRVSVRLY